MPKAEGVKTSGGKKPGIVDRAMSAVKSKVDALMEPKKEATTKSERGPRVKADVFRRVNQTRALDKLEKD